MHLCYILKKLDINHTWRFADRRSKHQYRNVITKLHRKEATAISYIKIMDSIT